MSDTAICPVCYSDLEHFEHGIACLLTDHFRYVGRTADGGPDFRATGSRSFALVASVDGASCVVAILASGDAARVFCERMEWSDDGPADAYRDSLPRNHSISEVSIEIAAAYGDCDYLDALCAMWIVRSKAGDAMFARLDHALVWTDMLDIEGTKFSIESPENPYHAPHSRLWSTTPVDRFGGDLAIDVKYGIL
jgi:hypothetical protein